MASGAGTSPVLSPAAWAERVQLAALPVTTAPMSGRVFAAQYVHWPQVQLQLAAMAVPVCMGRPSKQAAPPKAARTRRNTHLAYCRATGLENAIGSRPRGGQEPIRTRLPQGVPPVAATIRAGHTSVESHGPLVLRRLGLHKEAISEAIG